MIPVFEAAVTAQFLTSRVLPRLAEMPNVPPVTDEAVRHDSVDHDSVGPIETDGGLSGVWRLEWSLRRRRWS
jgi:hypothetical protein